MSQLSLQGTINTTDLSQVYDPSNLQKVIDQNGYSSNKTSDQFEISGPGFDFHLNGNGLTYNGNLLVGGTVSGADEAINGNQVFAHTGLSVTIDQINQAKAGGTYALASFILGGDDAIQGSFTAADDDLILGSSGNDSIAGGLGKDTLAGNQGNDIVLGNQGDDVAVGGQGNDIVVGGKDLDIVFGNEGNDTCFGNEGADTVFAGIGDDLVFGGQGDDVVYGNQGNDTLYGNEGADTFRFNQGDGADIIMDFSRGQGDLIDLQGLSHTVSQGANGDAIINVFGGSTIELFGVGASSVDNTYFKS